jgi:hypothetical protein
MPNASAITIKKGASVKSVPRGIDRIFIEQGRRSASNGAQRRCRDTTGV